MERKRLLEQCSKTDLLLPGWRRPDFFIVGAAKSGTTSLYSYLVQHPAIFMPDPKEPHFFYDTASPGTPVLGEKDLKEYLKLFEGVPANVRAGEASTSYLYVENAPQEIERLQRDARIIMVLRNPVDRAYSQYWNEVRDGREHESFQDALKLEEERKQRNSWHGFHYVDTGRYADQVSRYLEVFGHDRVQIHLFEDLPRDAYGVCRKTFSFLNVDPDCQIDVTKAYNAGGQARSKLLGKLLGTRKISEPIGKVLPVKWRHGIGEGLRKLNSKPKPEMEPETKRELQKTFRDDILRLEDLIGRDLSGWRD